MRFLLTLLQVSPDRQGEGIETLMYQRAEALSRAESGVPSIDGMVTLIPTADADTQTIFTDQGFSSFQTVGSNQLFGKAFTAENNNQDTNNLTYEETVLTEKRYPVVGDYPSLYSDVGQTNTTRIIWWKDNGVWFAYARIQLMD